MKTSRSVTVDRPSQHGFLYRLNQNKVLLLMCLPAILFFLFMSYAPMPGAYVAFTSFNYNAGIFGSEFVGWQNFEFLFSSGTLLMLLRNTILYNLVFIVLGNIIQVFLAILLNEVACKRFVKVAQSLMFLPYFISAVLIGLLVYNLLNADFGFIPSLIRSMGGEMSSVYSDPYKFPIVIVLAKLWQSTGYGTVVYFAAICGIDASMMEAAKVDGANGFQRIRYITLPCLKGTMIILFLFAIGGIVKGDFGLFYNLVGMNSVLYPTTDIIETYVYRCMMNNFNFSSGTAVGLFQSVFGFVLVMLANGIVKKLDPDYTLF